MKKTIAFFLTVFSVLILVSCGSNTLSINVEESKSKMETLAEGDGYEISIINQPSGYIHNFGKKGNVEWYSETANGRKTVAVAVMNEGETVYYFFADGKWTRSELDENRIFRGYKSTSYTYLYPVNDLDGALVKGRSAKIAGRKCDTYTYNNENYLALSYKIWVDKELGIALKYEMESENEMGEKTVMEVTSFVTGDKVSVPDFSLATPLEK